MYQLSQLARPQANDLLTQAEAGQLAAGANDPHPAPGACIPAVLRLNHHHKQLPGLRFLVAINHRRSPC